MDQARHDACCELLDRSNSKKLRREEPALDGSRLPPFGIHRSGFTVRASPFGIHRWGVIARWGIQLSNQGTWVVDAVSPSGKPLEGILNRASWIAHRFQISQDDFWIATC